MNPDSPPVFFDPSNPTAFMLAFVALWFVISALLSLMGGWFTLAREYRLEGSFEGKKWWFRSANFRHVVSYSSALIAGYGSAGVYLAVFPLFRFMHPPLQVPWGDLSKRRMFFGLFYTLKFARCPSVTVTVSRFLIRKIEAAAQKELAAA